MGDERGQIAVARAIGGEQYQAKPIVELEFTTDDERQLAALSFAEKLVILDSLKERVQPIIQARKVRRERQVQLLSQRV